MFIFALLRFELKSVCAFNSYY